MPGPLSWTLGEAAAAVGGRLHGPSSLSVTSVGTDSRTIEPGALFVAVAGETFDGHDFAAEALARGAVAAIVSRVPTGDTIEPRIEVEDTLGALRDLAAFRRGEIEVPVVAVTGSTGKTSTKDMLSHVLPGAWASPASFNNEIGVPLTVLATPAAARYLVAEVGSRGRGHIAWLMPAVRPDVSIITNLGVVHLETFGTTDLLADAKFELVEALGPSGVAVLPRGETRLARAHAGRTVTFGDAEGADVWFDGVVADASGRCSFRIRAGSDVEHVTLQMAGGHQPWNAVAAAGAALALGRDLGQIARDLERAQGSPGRMEIHRGRRTIVNDAYNANPDSMEAALRTVASMPGRHVAVVGLMAELGTASEAEHRRIGALARDLGFAAVIVVGDEPGLAEAAGDVARPVANAQEAAAWLGGYLEDGDVVLVKASHAIGLERLADHLAKEAGA